MNYYIYADGGCKNNGKHGKAEPFCSFAVYRCSRTPEGAELHRQLKSLKPVHHASRLALHCADHVPTNNQAEANALAMAIAWCVNEKLVSPVNDIHIFMDSELVLNQFLGLYRTRHRHLRDVYSGIYTMLGNHSKKHGFDAEKCFHLKWIPGETMKQTIIGH